MKSHSKHDYGWINGKVINKLEVEARNAAALAWMLEKVPLSRLWSNLLSSGRYGVYLFAVGYGLKGWSKQKLDMCAREAPWSALVFALKYFTPKRKQLCTKQLEQHGITV